jgi:hypothetical protein
MVFHGKISKPQNRGKEQAQKGGQDRQYAPSLRSCEGPLNIRKHPLKRVFFLFFY